MNSVCLLLLIFSIHISGPATVQNQNFVYLLSCCKQLGWCKYKIYNMRTVNFVITQTKYIQNLQHDTIFNCISIGVYIYNFLRLSLKGARGY